MHIFDIWRRLPSPKVRKSHYILAFTNEHFPTKKLNEIKVIESLNALNLESYLKRKFKQQRHPLFNSTEWFLLTKSELKYFTNDEYKNDADFMKILNYKLDV